MNGGSNKLKVLKKLDISNGLGTLRRMKTSERPEWWNDGYRRFPEHFKWCYQHHQLCCRHYHLYYRRNPQPYGKYIVDGDKVSSVVKIQINQEVP